MTMPVMAAPRPGTSPRAERDGRTAQSADGFAASLSTMLRPDAGRAGVPAAGTPADGAAAADGAVREEQGEDVVATAAREEAMGDTGTDQAEAQVNVVHNGAAAVLLAPAATVVVPEGTLPMIVADPTADSIVAEAKVPAPAVDSTTVTTLTGPVAGPAPAPEPDAMTASEPVDDMAPGVSDSVDARPETEATAPHAASDTLPPADAHAAAATARGDRPGGGQADPQAADATARGDRPGGGHAGPQAADAPQAGTGLAEPADTAATHTVPEPQAAVPETREAVPAPVAPARITPSAGPETSLVVESVESATTTGAAQARPAGETAAPTATPVVSRIVELVERLRTEPPPRQLVIDLDQFGVGRLVISLRGDTVLVSAADSGARPDPQWWSELGEALDHHGWSLDGGGEQPSRDRQQPQSQPHPAPAFVTQPRRRVNTDRGLRL